LPAELAHVYRAGQFGAVEVPMGASQHRSGLNYDPYQKFADELKRESA